jgi:tetratricopeptide (TPR) repeat protein
MSQQHPIRQGTAAIAPKARRIDPPPGVGFDDFGAHQREGVLLHLQGRNEAAIACLEAALRAAPAEASIWSDLGVVYAAIGGLQKALDCYDQAIALDPNHAAALNNRGNALTGLGRPLDALASIDLALAVKPRFAAAYNSRGAALRLIGRLAEALASFDQALAVDPRNTDTYNNRANTLLELGRAEEALKDYDRALSINPVCANAFNNRGNALLNLGRRHEALASYETALALNPHSAEALSNRGNALRALKRFEEAALSYGAALVLAPGNSAAHNNLGNALMDLGRPADALASYDAALALRPDYVQALSNRAQALLRLKRAPEALSSCDKAIALDGAYVEALSGRGDALAKLGREEEALESYDRALSLRPPDALAHNNKGLALFQLGRFEEGEAEVKAAIKLAPENLQFYYNLALSKRFKSGDRMIGAMESLALECSGLHERERIGLYFALGKAFADIEDWTRSFHYLALGNAAKRKETDYDEGQALGILRRTGSVYTSALMRLADGRGDASPVPIFVVGMPRSGSTLVEQILSRNGAVHSAGESNHFDLAIAELGGAAGDAVARPEAVLEMTAEDFRLLGANYLRRVRAAAPEAGRIVNKMLENFRLAGLIALALPGARILHVRRDPVDACLSCYSTLFVENLPYAYDLAELGRYWRAYDALMEVWRSVLPRGRMLEVRYEEVVADLEGQTRQILAHCGLDWDPRCLDFHRGERSVRTASFAQVRHPLYRSSVGRWRNCQAHLGPLLEALSGRVETSCAQLDP